LSQRINDGDFTLRGLVAELAAGPGVINDGALRIKQHHTKKLGFKPAAWIVGAGIIP
jgi:hypothetical protein